MTKLNKLFTPKQIEVLQQELLNPKWKLMVNYGAVRAGKTYVDNFVFLFELRHAAMVAQNKDMAHPLYILAGVSSKSIYNNVLTEIANTFGLEFKFDKHNSFQVKFNGLPPVTVVQAFTGSIAGLGAIRGMTSTGAYVNEASLANEAVFTEIRQRCSVEGARVVCDTNPDVPNHWLKTKYIDNPNDSDTIISNHFVLDDNTRLDPDYVTSLKETTPTGMFYDRSILGLWVSGEGVVYRDFDERKMVVPSQAIPDRLTIICGVDWGYEHAGSVVVMGFDRDGRWYLLEEHTKQYEEIDYWVRIAKSIQERYGYNVPFYADSARPEHVARFKREKINCNYGYKSVMTGIEHVAKLMKQGAFFVSREGIKGQQFLDEIYQYVWNETTGEPVKESDHTMDAMRYAIATYQFMQERQQPNNRREQAQVLKNFGLA